MGGEAGWGVGEELGLCGMQVVDGPVVVEGHRAVHGQRADDADVRWLANLMTRNQRREIREMEAIREALRGGGAG